MRVRSVTNLRWIVVVAVWGIRALAIMPARQVKLNAMTAHTSTRRL
ncbi:hypothetical protein [Corynebacterium glutamicum]|nr:hypothetical protein [Corynebacterium glutamicum]